MARPIPLFPPVISATLPSSFFMILITHSIGFKVVGFELAPPSVQAKLKLFNQSMVTVDFLMSE